MKKSTQELLAILKQSTVQDYLADNESEFINVPLYEYLNALLVQTGLKKAEVIERSRLFKVYAYQIFDGRKNPSRDKLIQLSFEFGLNLDGTQRLLKTAGVAELYPRNKRDGIIISAIENGLSIIDCDILLDDLNQQPLQ